MAARTMNGLAVVIASPTNKGRLHTRYDREAEVLIAESRVERPWPFGIDIDGSIIFDLDEERRLACVDVHTPKRYWIDGAGPTFAKRPPAGDLVFTEEAVLLKSFSQRIRITRDRTRQLVHVEFDSNQQDPRLAALSDSCIGHVSGGMLVALTFVGVP